MIQGMTLDYKSYKKMVFLVMERFYNISAILIQREKS